MYSDIVRDHIARIRNVGPLEGATHHGMAGTPGDGPYAEIWLEVVDGFVVRAAYQCYACPAAIASASQAVEMAIGLSLSDATGMTAADIMAALGGLPEGKEFNAGVVARAVAAAAGRR